VFVILAVFLEGREVVFDRVQLGRIGRQKEHAGAGVRDQCLRGRAFVEGDVVQDHGVRGSQEGTGLASQPRIKDGRVVRAGKEERRDKGFPVKAAINEVRGRRCPERV
jgi:hypothetical protein